jgi:hypothetical protein
MFAVKKGVGGIVFQWMNDSENVGFQSIFLETAPTKNFFFYAVTYSC